MLNLMDELSAYCDEQGLEFERKESAISFYSGKQIIAKMFKVPAGIDLWVLELVRYGKKFIASNPQVLVKENLDVLY